MIVSGCAQFCEGLESLQPAWLPEEFWTTSSASCLLKPVFLQVQLCSLMDNVVRLLGFQVDGPAWMAFSDLGHFRSAAVPKAAEEKEIVNGKCRG